MYSCERFNGRVASAWKEKWTVFTPDMEGSPESENIGLRSARRRDDSGVPVPSTNIDSSLPSWVRYCGSGNLGNGEHT